MRIMAVDYGDARTGVAVSDESAALVGEAWVIHGKNLNAVVQTIAGAAVARGVGVIAVGYPKNMNDTVGPRALKSERLAEALRAELSRLQSGAGVVLWDERLTTSDAHRVLSDAGRHGKKRKESVDAVAASLILEGYLGYHNNAECRMQNAEMGL